MFDRPAFLPDSSRSQKELWTHGRNRARGVNVYKLSDGTYVQDTPTAENTNTRIPMYPEMPDQEIGGVVARVYDNWTKTRTDTVINPRVVLIYLGGHATPVSSTEAAALTAAGYGGCIT